MHAISLASMSGHLKGRGVQCHWQVCMDITNVGFAMSLVSMSGHGKGRCMQRHWQVCSNITKVGACNVIGKYVWDRQR